MKRFGLACGALIGWCLGILVPAYGRWPLAVYDPAARAWSFGRSPGPVPITYYGLLGWGVVGAALGAGLGAIVARRERPDRAEQSDAVRLGTAWALTSVVLVVAYYTFQLWP